LKELCQLPKRKKVWENNRKKTDTVCREIEKRFKFSV